METANDVMPVVFAPHHRPAMVSEVLAFLQPRPGADFLDGTVGGGGHAAALLEACGPTGRLLGLDRDRDACGAAERTLRPFSDRLVLVHENFSRASDVLSRLGWGEVDGVLLDLGFSSLQVEDGARGFSFHWSGPLDMRMNQDDATCAADIVNQASEAELRRIFRDFGEERAARAYARAVVQARAVTPLLTTTALVQTIEQVGKRAARFQVHPVHPATRVFQALRIVVNLELDHLAAFLRDGYRLLRPGGRMVILSYHSLEDRLVKTAFRRWAATCVCPPRLQMCTCDWLPQVRILTPKPLTPTPEEIAANPRSRSARLRAVERCGKRGEV